METDFELSLERHHNSKQLPRAAWMNHSKRGAACLLVKVRDETKKNECDLMIQNWNDFSQTISPKQQAVNVCANDSSEIHG